VDLAVLLLIRLAGAAIVAWNSSKPNVMTVRSGEMVVLTVPCLQPLPEYRAELIWILSGLSAATAAARRAREVSFMLI